MVYLQQQLALPKKKVCVYMYDSRVSCGLINVGRHTGVVEWRQCFINSRFQSNDSSESHACTTTSEKNRADTVTPPLQFAAYEQLKQALLKWREQRALSTPHFFALAALAKAVATVLTYPLQVLQTRLRHGTKSTATVVLLLLQVHVVCSSLFLTKLLSTV